MQYAHSPATPKSDIAVVIAHRGYWELGAAIENSASAVAAAQTNCIEAVEIDLAITSDGIPVPTHDVYLQRISTGTGSVYTTPYSGSPTSWLYQSARNRYGAVTTSPLSTFGDKSFDYTRDLLAALVQYPTLVLVIDCKGSLGLPPNVSTYDVLKKVVARINAYPNGASLFPRILFKARLPDLPSSPATILSDLGLPTNCATPQTSTCENFNLAPVFYPNDVCPATACVPNDKITAYLKLPLYGGTTPNTYSFLWYPEPSTPYPQDDLQPYLGSAAGTNVTSVYVPNNDWPEGGSQSYGNCCVLRNTSPTVSANANYKGDLEYGFSQSYNRFVADKVFEAMSYLQAQNKRNVCRLSGQC
jgi:hypothetical protein